MIRLWELLRWAFSAGNVCLPVTRLGLRVKLLLVVLCALHVLEARAEAAPARSFAENATYASECAGCHGKTMGGALGPPLKGEDFVGRWRPKGHAALGAYISRSMPPNKPGGLSAEAYEDLTSYIERNNESAIATKTSENAGMAGAEQNHDPYFDSVITRRGKLLSSLGSVTEAQLRDPPAGDWLSVRRTDDGHAYSPLVQINRTNAASLTLAWSLSIPAGSNEITPLVHDGVMFLNSHGKILAIDVQTSDILWQFDQPTAVKQIGPPITQPRGMAILGDRLFVPTLTNHVIALDVRTGQIAWDHLVSGMHDWMRFSASPLAVHGKIILGATGCWGSSSGEKCFVVALDARSGDEIWKFHTIPTNGEPGSSSWDGTEDAERSGASVWSPVTYDADDNLLLFGTGQTYHIAALMRRSPVRDKANAGLYTDSTIALNPDSGKLAWHFQHMARDVWDLDWSFERVVATIQVDSKPRRVVMTVGKVGILDVLDAKTGKFLSSYDLGYQNLIAKVDQKTGWKTTDPAMEPSPSHPVFVCPFAAGVRNWPGTSFDPTSGILYIGVSDSCMDFSWNKSEDFDITYRARPRPKNDGFGGGVVALNVSSGQLVWKSRYRAPSASAALTSAGGLLFEGSRDRRFRATDSATGKILWETRLDNIPSATPIAFMAGGIEYVAITTGGGNPNDVIRAFMTPETGPLPSGNTLWVFSLKDAHPKP